MVISILLIILFLFFVNPVFTEEPSDKLKYILNKATIVKEGYCVEKETQAEFWCEIKKGEDAWYLVLSDPDNYKIFKILRIKFDSDESELIFEDTWREI